jgi:hypothetical protein
MCIARTPASYQESCKYLEDIGTTSCFNMPMTSYALWHTTCFAGGLLWNLHRPERLATTTYFNIGSEGSEVCFFIPEIPSSACPRGSARIRQGAWRSKGDLVTKKKPLPWPSEMSSVIRCFKFRNSEKY